MGGASSLTAAWLACVCLAVSGARAGGAALAATSGVSPYKVPSGPQAYCAPCDVRACPPHISPEACNGTLVKDDCGCCPRCDHSQRQANLTQTSSQQSSKYLSIYQSYQKGAVTS